MNHSRFSWFNNVSERLLGRLRGHGFIRDVTILGMGMGGAQVIAVAASPVLTRLYTPHDLGILALFTAASAIFTIAATGRYEMAIALPKSDADAANILGLSCLIVLLMALLAAVTLTMAGHALIQTFGAPELDPFLFLIPVAVLAIGLYQPLPWWAARRQQYRQSSVSQILRSIGGTGVQIALGLAKSGPVGLILGTIVGQLIAISFLAAQVWRRDGQLIGASVSLKEMWRLGRDLRDFPKFNMPRAVLYSMAQTVPPILLVMYFDTAVAGMYWLATRVCQMPITILGETVRQVLYQRAAAQFNRGEGLLEMLTKSTVGLVFIMAVPFFVTVFYAPAVFEIAFGEEWAQAGIFSQWLVIPSALDFICGPCVTLVPIYGCQRLLFVFESLTLVPRLAIIPLVSYVGDDAATIAIYSVAGALFHLCVLAFVFLHTWKHHASLTRTASVEA
jgi:O-antigen/teichoic acid export membrane protein